MQRSCTKSRKERELVFRRNLILDGVEKAFTESSFVGASVEKIAARAEVAPATLYNLFGGKEELFAAVVERRMEEFLNSVETSGKSSGGLEELAEVVKAAFLYFEQHQASFHLYLATTHGVPWNIRVRLGERAHVLYQRFISYVERSCQQALRAKGRPTRLAAVAFVGALNASIADWITRRDRPTANKAWADAWVIMRRLLAGPRRQ